MGCELLHGFYWLRFMLKFLYIAACFSRRTLERVCLGLDMALIPTAAGRHRFILQPELIEL